MLTLHKIEDLNLWCKALCELELKFGYYSEACKAWLTVEKKLHEITITSFKDTQIKITSTKKRHLRAVIRTMSYKKNYINEKINI